MIARVEATVETTSSVEEASEEQKEQGLPAPEVARLRRRLRLLRRWIEAGDIVRTKDWTRFAPIY